MLSLSDPAKIFLAFKSSYLLFFQTLPIKLELGLQSGGQLTIDSNLPRPINWLRIVRLCCAFYQPLQHPVEQCWVKVTCFDFSSSIFIFLGHILSTGVVAPNSVKLSRYAQYFILFFWLIGHNDWHRWWHWNNLSLCFVVSNLSCLGYGWGCPNH